MLRGLLFLGYVALAVFCIADVLQSPDENPHGLPRWGWVVIILFFPLLGAGTWLVMKYMRGNGGNNRNSRPQVAPDDDPEYLSWLREQERRRRKRGESDGPH